MAVERARMDGELLSDYLRSQTALLDAHWDQRLDDLTQMLRRGGTEEQLRSLLGATDNEIDIAKGIVAISNS